MNKIFCFGELLLRISPSENWQQNGVLDSYIGGAEINVALALAKWNLPIKCGTALPNNYFSDKIIESLKNKKLDTSAILRSGNRIGLYYLQQGADLKSANVIYDRMHSSFAELQPHTIDWQSVLQDVGHVHITAISAAVSQNAASVCEELLKEARNKNIFISLDLNYREKLWKYGKKPIDIMPNLAQYGNMIMGNIWSANIMLGAQLSPDVEKFSTQSDFLQEAKNSAQNIMNKFPNCSMVANTFRFNIEKESIRYFGTICDKNQLVYSEEKIYSNTKDKSGSGDCFMAGVIYGLHSQKTLQQTVDFATVAATGKFYEIGDYTQQTVENIEQKILK